MAFLKSCLLAAFVAAVSATPCPYGQLAERGELSEADAAKFFDVRAHGPAAVESLMQAHEIQKREFDRQEQFYKRQLDLGQLPLGGGLLGGILQPFTGILQDLDVPVPQEQGLLEIPGDDPDHQFEYPRASDVRGMCPTLNTMANHGFIARNGITTFAEAANACQITLGFGYDTCVFLSALGLMAGGDLATGAYSIGGQDDRVPNTLGPALGISKHGVFEIDNSPSRQDIFFGNQANFQLDRWNHLVDLSKQYGGFGNDMWAHERVETYNYARTHNPEFNAEVKWLAVSLAERVFVFRALPNGTDETNANFENVAPFFLNETFPSEWFRRATPFSLVDLANDIATLLATSPQLTIPGRNENINNFVPIGIDLASFTPQNATCLLATTILDLVPGQIAPVIAENYDVVEAFLNGAVKPFFANAQCDDDTFAAPGPNAGNPEAGSSTSTNILYNGRYISDAPNSPPHPPIP